MNRNLEGCQIPCLPRMAEGTVPRDSQALIRRLKRTLAVPWNYHVKRQLKNFYHLLTRLRNHAEVDSVSDAVELKTGDMVWVRPLDEIQSTLDPFKELKGCAFLPDMEQYCGTTRRVLQVMERFLDERDYKVKKVKGIVLLEEVICLGTPVFGRCDRCCHLFWREEWLKRVEG